jgi:hypothetical protein
MKSGPSWGKKEDPLTPEEQQQGRLGDDWDHVLVNPRTRFIVSLVCGKRTFENSLRLLQDFKTRTNGRLPDLFTSDELPSYERALLQTYGVLTPRQRQGDRGRFPDPVLEAPADLVYATVHKERENGRVVRVQQRLVFGTAQQLDRVLQASPVSGTVNTSFVERYNGTARHRNSRQVRKTYAFSKDWELHEQQSFLSMLAYNLCWTPRTLSVKNSQGRAQRRSPAMAQGVADHVWSVREFLRHQVVARC